MLAGPGPCPKTYRCFTIRARDYAARLTPVPVAPPRPRSTRLRRRIRPLRPPPLYDLALYPRPYYPPILP